MDQLLPNEEDEQLRLAIALSLQEVELESSAARGSGNQVENVQGAQSGDTTVPQPENRNPSHAKDHGAKLQSGIMGLDRHAMEQERLARLAQAKGGLGQGTPRDADKERPRKRNLSDGTSAYPTEGSRLKRPRPHHPSENDGVIDLSSAAKAESASNDQRQVPYPRGTVKQTWCLGFERLGSDVKLEEVLQKNTLQLAVLSSFIWDVDWVLAKLKPDTKVVLVMSAKDEDVKNHFLQQAKDLPGQSVRMCFPPMPGNVNCMHSKLMLLAHPTYLRIVVPTANLVPFDWGETGVMENTVFMIDLPRRSDGSRVDPGHLTSFGQELCRFCKELGLAADLIQSIGKFDFSATEKIAFVHTIGGEHRSADDWRHTGYPGLGRAVRSLGLHTENPVRIDYVTSSIGALNGDFLQMLYQACKGDDGMIEFQRRINRKRSSARTGTSPDEKQSAMDRAAVQDGFSIYFPSEETVKASRGGYQNGGTICFQERWFLSPNFDRAMLRECRSERKGLLMHNKLLFVQEDGSSAASGSESDAKAKMWAYVGSANCSESAWGRLVKDRSSHQAKLTCRNWECGVLIHIAKDDSRSFLPSIGSAGLGRFKHVVPVPMQLPARKFSDQDIRPWYFTDSS